VPANECGVLSPGYFSIQNEEARADKDSDLRLRVVTSHRVVEDLRQPLDFCTGIANGEIAGRNEDEPQRFLRTRYWNLQLAPQQTTILSRYSVHSRLKSGQSIQKRLELVVILALVFSHILG